MNLNKNIYIYINTIFFSLFKSDGVGRTGTFILIDMILNKITMKGAKEIDLAATVEYLRDQRVDMLKTKVIIK